MVISAGFSETGKAGGELEDELMQTVRNAGMRMVGPNCMGLINMDSAISMNGQFGPLSPPAGNVAMSSQSGALGYRNSGLRIPAGHRDLDVRADRQPGRRLW